MRMILGLALLSALTSCTGLPPAADKGILFNKSVEDASNQLVLLNVLRASQRMPMYYTRFSTLQSQGVLKSSVTSMFQLGPRSSDILGLSIPLGADQNDTVGVQVLDDQKFIAGIIDRTKPETLAFYLNQGWPRDVLFHLFIERIEISEKYVDDNLDDLKDCKDHLRLDKNEKGLPTNNVIFDNNPTSPKTLGCFQRLLWTLEDKFDLGLSQDSVFQAANYTLIDQSASSAAAAVEALKAGYSFEKSVVSFQSPSGKKRELCRLSVGKATVVTQFRLSRHAKSSGTPTPDDRPGDVVQSSGVGALDETHGGPAEEPSAVDACGDKVKPDADKPAKIAAPSKVPMRFFLRSPDSMIYYLGEILRAQGVVDAATKKVSAPLQVRSSSNTKVELFKVEKGEVDNAAVSVDFQGGTYSVPLVYPKDDHRSTQVVGLINQLIAMQKEPGSAPTIPAVTVISTN